MSSAIQIDGVTCNVLSDRDSGSIEGDSWGGMSASMTYKCNWVDWQTVWAALIGFPVPPQLIHTGPPRDPHIHPYYSEMICYHAQVFGLGTPGFANGKITYPHAFIIATYGSPLTTFGGTGEEYPDIGLGTVDIALSAEHISMGPRTYEWAWAALAATGKPQQELTVIVPYMELIVRRTSVYQLNLLQLKTAFGRINEFPWNGAPIGHLLFIGLDIPKINALGFIPIDVTLTFKERIPASWNHAIHPSQLATEGPYTGTLWHALWPEPYGYANYEDVFGTLLNPL